MKRHEWEELKGSRRSLPKRAVASGCGAGGFTLMELLVAIAIIILLAALVLAGLSGAKRRVQTTLCRNHLRQIGIALTAYASESHHYPSIIVEQLKPFRTTTLADNLTWADALYPYYPLRWTNASWHCPAYIAQRGIILPQPPMLSVMSSYSYNCVGILGEGWEGVPEYVRQLNLGLGRHPRADAPESTVVAPSEMYAVADTRWWTYRHYGESGLAGKWNMSPWKYVYHVGNPPREVVHVETAPPHDQGYNMLFVDGHVALVKRSDYLFPPRTAHNWNRDNQPHPEAWAPTGQWVVQQ
jgi:prepilin-type processing-associated H-X9-DG protein